ncbi:DNA repair protein XRCC3 isoform X1 [Petromyzon marinus]|uniref:DNA repair protein XRCC3 isoform X1 n=1 Tax=Petromyzon marinus TaxID=7757 RepID=A0AAJ7WN43_PETMA|nr:DNA repair protein XRCC3 isoform X1 [Petromyzon marinus]
MEELIINPRVQAALKRAHIYTLKEVICLSGPDLERMTKLSSTDVKHLHHAVATALFNRPAVTALQMWRGECPGQGVRLSLGCPVLDAFLQGGFPVPGVSELVGESATGKTQICMQLSLTVQYPREYGGLGAGAVYVCTEDAFPNKRLCQMIQAQAKMREDVPPDVLAKISFGENIYIEHAADVASLYTCITRRLPVLLSRGVVRLIVVDSIAALFRSEFSVHEAVARAQQLRKFGAQLHELSNTYSAPVICVNQVTGNVSGQDHGSGAQSYPCTGHHLGQHAAHADNGEPGPRRGHSTHRCWHVASSRRPHGHTRSQPRRDPTAGCRSHHGARVRATPPPVVLPLCSHHARGCGSRVAPQLSLATHTSRWIKMHLS